MISCISWHFKFDNSEIVTPLLFDSQIKLKFDNSEIVKPLLFDSQIRLKTTHNVCMVKAKINVKFNFSFGFSKLVLAAGNSFDGLYLRTSVMLGQFSDWVSQLVYISEQPHHTIPCSASSQS